MANLLTDRVVMIVAADIIVALSCVVLHVSAMLRFHARPDLPQFRFSLLMLAGFFAVVTVVFAWDAFEVLTAQRGLTVYVRWACAAASVIAAVAFMRRTGREYYRRISSPEQCDHHRREIDRLMAELQAALGKDGTNGTG